MGSEQSSNKENNNRTQYASGRQRQSVVETPSTVIYERSRNPYSYVQTDLQNEARRRAESMYPNLNTNNNTNDVHGVNIRTRTSQNTTGFVYVRTEDASTQPTVQRTAPSRPTPPRTFTPSMARADTSTRTFTPMQSATATRPVTPMRTVTPSRLVTPAATAPSAPASAPSFSRSASRDRRSGNDAYCCPTCNNRFGMDIFGCPSGHSSCKDCRMRGAACGLCGLVITDTRNFAMQDFIAQIKSPCPNASDGCTLQIKTIDMDLHASECPYAEMACPVNSIYGNCRWRGKSSQMLAHFNDVHPAERQGDVDTELILPNICSESHTLYLVPMSPYYFIFHVKVDSTQRNVYMTAQLLGTGMSAAKWNYEVHVYNKREPRRKFMYVAPCTAAITPVRDIFNKAECATIPLPYALTFINEGILTYKFFIKRVNDKSNFAGNDSTQRVYNKPNFRGNGRGRRGFHHKTNN